MPSPRATRAVLEAAQKAMLESKGAAKAVAQQLDLPIRGVGKAFYPGDAAKRLQRAEAQGFDVLNPLFHGGSSEGFIPGRPDKIFLTPQYHSAKTYADNAYEKWPASGDRPIVLPFFMHKDARTFDASNIPGLTRGGNIADPDSVLEFLKEARGTRGRKLGGSIGGMDRDFFKEYYQGGPLWNSLEDNKGYEDFADIGFDAVKVKDTDHAMETHDAYRVMNPNAIRLSFADFNPRFAKALRKSERVPTWLAGLGITAGAPLLSDSK